ncbi:unnamed protein product [Discula destructiva]
MRSIAIVAFAILVANAVPNPDVFKIARQSVQAVIPEAALDAVQDQVVPAPDSVQKEDITEDEIQITAALEQVSSPDSFSAASGGDGGGTSGRRKREADSLNIAAAVARGYLDQERAEVDSIVGPLETPAPYFAPAATGGRGGGKEGGGGGRTGERRTAIPELTAAAAAFVATDAADAAKRAAQSGRGRVGSAMRKREADAQNTAAISHLIEQGTNKSEEDQILVDLEVQTPDFVAYVVKRAAQWRGRSGHSDKVKRHIAIRTANPGATITGFADPARRAAQDDWPGLTLASADVLSQKREAAPQTVKDGGAATGVGKREAAPEATADVLKRAAQSRGGGGLRGGRRKVMPQTTAPPMMMRAAQSEIGSGGGSRAARVENEEIPGTIV